MFKDTANLRDSTKPARRVLLPFRWQFWLTVVLFAALGYAALVVTDQRMMRMLSLQHEAQVSTGLPPSFAALPLERPKEGENAAEVYRAAAAKLKEAAVDLKEVERLLPRMNCGEFVKWSPDPAFLQEAQALLAAREAGLALVLQAQTMPGALFGRYDEAATSDTTEPDLAFVLEIAGALRDQAVLAAAQGNAAAAYPWVLAGFRLANDLRNEPLLSAMRVRVAVCDMAVEALNQCLVQSGAPSPEAAEGLRKELRLLRDSKYLPLVMLGERCWQSMTLNNTIAQSGRFTRAAILVPSALFANARMEEMAEAVSIRRRGPRQQALWAVLDEKEGMVPWVKVRESQIPDMIRELAGFEVMVDHSLLSELAIVLEIHHQAHGKYPEFAELDRSALPPLDSYDYTLIGSGWAISNFPAVFDAERNGAPDKVRQVAMCNPGD